MLEDRKPQKIGDSCNNNKNRCPQMFYRKGILKTFPQNHRKIPVPDSLS